MKTIFKVQAQSETFFVPSQKADRHDRWQMAIKMKV